MTAERLTQPWRLACPDCGCTDWRGRASGFYYCPQCQGRFDRLRDKKTGGLVG